jgi:hypothetical protein
MLQLLVWIVLIEGILYIFILYHQSEEIHNMKRIEKNLFAGKEPQYSMLRVPTCQFFCAGRF